MAEAGALALVEYFRPADRHPALVYLARLAPGSRRTMRESLDIAAGILTDGEGDHATFPWEQLRYEHTAAVRAILQEQYEPATANKILSARKVCASSALLRLPSGTRLSRSIPA